MACEIVFDDQGKPIGIKCGSPWGIGTYYHCHDDECFCVGQSVYGFPPNSMNPEDFTPDPECCSQKEIASWEEARELWNRKDYKEK